MDELTRRRQAIDDRDAASKRVRRLTLGTAAAAAAGAGAIAGVAATSGSPVHTSAGRQVLAAATTRVTTVSAVPAPTATVPAASDDSAPSSTQATPAAPQAVPTSAVASAPVAVSGGS